MPVKNKTTDPEAVSRWTPDEWSSLVTAIFRPIRLSDCCEAAAEKCASLLHADGIEIHVSDIRSRSLEPKAKRGFAVGGTEPDNAPHPGERRNRIFEKGLPFFLENLEKENGSEWAAVHEEGFKSYAGIPLLADDVRMGVLGLYFKSARHFRDQAPSLLAIGRLLGLAIFNVQQYERAMQKAQRLIGVSRAMAVTRQLVTPDHVLEDVARMLVSGLGFDLSWIGIFSADGNRLEGRAGSGEGMKRPNVYQTFSMAEISDIVRAIRQPKPVPFRRAEVPSSSAFGAWLDALRIGSGGLVPLLRGDEAIGVIGGFSASDRPLDEEDMRLLTSVSEQASIAFENATLYEQVTLSEGRYRTLFESAGTGKAIVDAEGRFQLVNRPFVELSGYTADELVGGRSLFHFIAQKKNPAGMAGFPEKREVEFVDRKRDIKQVFVLTAPIPLTGDFLVSIVDVTRERELEKQLRESQELASLGELSAGIAHEIRNPLIAINTSVAILKDEKALSPEGQQVLDVVKEETDHLAAIVSDFLKYARPKKLVLEREDLNKLVRDALRRYKEQCGEKVVWIEQYDETLPSLYFDKHQLLQVIVNLLSNSMDAMPAGGKLVVQTALNGSRKADRVLIVIRDSGTGIAPDLLSKIFLPFFSTKEKGTGMGLAICRRIVNQHDGDIFVESEPDKGAMFTVSLPAHVQPSETGA